MILDSFQIYPLKALLVFLSFAVALPALGATEGAGAQGHVVVENFQVSYKVGEGGTYVAEYDETIHAVTPLGANSLGKRAWQHSTKMQDFVMLAAETIKNDGRRLPVKPEAIETQDGIVGNITFRDSQITSVTFPDLAAGDSVHVRYRYVQKEAPLSGVLSIVQTMTDALIVNRARLDIEFAADQLLNLDVHRLKKRRDEVIGATRYLSWDYSNKLIRSPEQAEANAALEGAHLFIGNMSSWDDVGSRYAAEHRQRTTPTAAIRALAKELTHGVTDEREKAHRIYDWVRKNIRYVATYLGNGAWAPHEASWVFENRYGDCKDHVVILETLLRASGIESSPALIVAATDDYSFPAVPVLHFDHVITWIPSLALFVDATADTIPFGLLPANEVDKPVLVAYGERNPVRTPMDGPENAEVIRHTSVKVFANGSADRQTDMQARGIASVWARDWYQGLGHGKQNEWALEQLKLHRLTGSASLTQQADDSVGTVTYRNTQHIDNFLADDEVGVMSLDAAFSGPISLPQFVGRFYDQIRTRPGVCRPVRVEDTVVVTFENGVAPIRLPRGRHIHTPEVDFDSEYQQNSSATIAHRTFVWSPPHYLCSAEDYVRLAPTMKLIVAALKAGLPYERNVLD